MADMASIIAGIDGYRRYEQNRGIDLQNQAQALQNEQAGKIMDLKTQLAALQKNPYDKYNIWDPVGRRQQLLSEDDQLKIASKWASSIKNLAPEKREQGYRQFLRAMPSLGIDVSDMPQGYDEGYIDMVAGLGVDTQTRYQNEQQNSRLERQIEANREARQDEFDKRLAAFDYENRYKSDEEKRRLAEKDEFVRGLGLGDDTTNRLLAANRGISVPEDKGMDERMYQRLTANPQDETAREYFANKAMADKYINALKPAEPKKYASGDLGLVQYMTDNGMEPIEAIQRVGKMTPEEKIAFEAKKAQVVEDAKTQNIVIGKQIDFDNNSRLERQRQTSRREIEAIKQENKIAEKQYQNMLNMSAEAYKASLPTQKMREINEQARVTGIPVEDIIKQDLAAKQIEAQNKMLEGQQKLLNMQYQQAQIDKARAELPYAGMTPQQRNYEYVKQHPEAAESPLFQGSGTNVTVNTGDMESSDVFDIKTLKKERAKQYVKDVEEYQNMVSKMPELQDTVARLKELAPIATYTTYGKVRDRIKQEFDSPTVASVAKDEYESIVANQILPLLRDTFGAQFTEREGNSLKATLGDPNKSSESKIKVLDSFINQKQKSIESKYRKLLSYKNKIGEDEEILDYSTL